MHGTGPSNCLGVERLVQNFNIEKEKFATLNSSFQKSKRTMQ